MVSLRPVSSYQIEPFQSLRDGNHGVFPQAFTAFPSSPNLARDSDIEQFPEMGIVGILLSCAFFS
jgi:hypothetical protein